MPPPSDDPPIEIRRSARRRRTATAYRDRGTIVVLLPARATRAQEQELVPGLVRRLLAQERRAAAPASDVDLQARAEALVERYLAGPAVAPAPTAVRWVTNQQQRWGSCTPGTGVIRLSHRLQTMPAWVVDYVLLHELAHLAEPGHGPAFRELVGRYPHATKAEGYLEGFLAGARHRPESPGGVGAEPPAGGSRGPSTGAY